MGIGRTARLRLKFGVDFFDADNDGDEDLIVANGHIDDGLDRGSSSVQFAQPNSLYEHVGGGRFEDVSDRAGEGLGDRQVSRGLATADFDGDGDLDIVVTNNAGTAQILINQSAPAGGFVMLWLEGTRANRSAIGARVVATVSGSPVERQVMGAQSYLSVSDLRVHLGLGGAPQADDVTIHWPGGPPQTIGPLRAGGFYHVRQGQPPRPFVPGERSVE
jgi:hypothetical protein